MRGLTVVIPSNSLNNLLPCLGSIRLNEPDVNIIVIDDGLLGFEGKPEDMHGIGVISGIKPFCFPRNCNLGILSASEDDIILLNDDALLETNLGFTKMQYFAHMTGGYGLLSSTTNVAGNPDQMPLLTCTSLQTARPTKRSIAFVCVLIPRATIAKIGLMDERFGGLTEDGRRIYGFCDNDYVRRTRAVGLEIGVYNGCFVDHASLRSAFRGDPHASADASLARQLYIQKWGNID